MAVVAVFEIHMERNIVGSIKPNISLLRKNKNWREVEEARQECEREDGRKTISSTKKKYNFFSRSNFTER
jgi:hypothetical protein